MYYRVGIAIVIPIPALLCPLRRREDQRPAFAAYNIAGHRVRRAAIGYTSSFRDDLSYHSRRIEKDPGFRTEMYSRHFTVVSEG